MCSFPSYHHRDFLPHLTAIPSYRNSNTETSGELSDREFIASVAPLVSHVSDSEDKTGVMFRHPKCHAQQLLCE